MIIEIGINLDKVKCKWYNTVKVALYIYVYIYIYVHTFNVKMATTLTSVKQTVFPEKKDELSKGKTSLYEIFLVVYPSQIYIYIYIYTITHNSLI